MRVPRQDPAALFHKQPGLAVAQGRPPPATISRLVKMLASADEKEIEDDPNPLVRKDFIVRTFKPSRRPSLPALTLLTLLVLLFAPQSSLAKAAAAYTAIHGSTARWIGGAHLLGRHAGSDYLTVGLVLRTSYPDQQAALLNSLYLKGGPAYHHWLTPAEFSARFAPAAGDVAGAKNLLLAAGLRMSPSPTPTLLLASGTFSQVEAAFHITINDYRLANGNEYFSNSFDAQVPSNLRPAVLGVFGLSNFPFLPAAYCARWRHTV
jgi:Pro-kumamolisin, activation domain